LVHFVRRNRGAVLGPSTRLLLLLCFFLFSTFCLFAQSPAATPASKLRIEIAFSDSLSAKPLDGHILLGISTDKNSEPRYQLREEEAQSAQFFGLDVDAWKPGTPAVFDSGTLGYPLVSLGQIPPGDYYVQAVLNI
jgi:hypothetical protein